MIFLKETKVKSIKLLRFSLGELISEKQAKNRNETCSNLALGTRLSAIKRPQLKIWNMLREHQLQMFEHL